MPRYTQLPGCEMCVFVGPEEDLNVRGAGYRSRWTE
jgi:hypothetical protein